MAYYSNSCRETCRNEDQSKGQYNQISPVNMKDNAISYQLLIISFEMGFLHVQEEALLRKVVSEKGVKQFKWLSQKITLQLRRESCTTRAITAVSPRRILAGYLQCASICLQSDRRESRSHLASRCLTISPGFNLRLSKFV